VEIPVGNEALRLRISGNYPWQEQVKIVIDSSSPVHHTLALRLPDWCDKPQVTLNGAPVTQDVRKGYLHISHLWQEGDTLLLTLPMPVRRIYGNPLVRHQAGQVAVQRGPLVYCLEQADNGEQLHNLQLPRDARFSTVKAKGFLPARYFSRRRAISKRRKMPSSRRCGTTIARRPAVSRTC
jgi:DUF1680 family protein